MVPNLTITFPIDPPFRVDFSQYSRVSNQPIEPSLPILEKIKKVGLALIENIGFFFVAVSKSSYSTLRNSGTSFKHIVLGYYGNLRSFRPPSDIYLAIFKVAFWILGMTWCTITTAVRLIYERNKDPSFTPNLLKHFSNPEIDIQHIRTKELTINVSAVPTDVTVDRLLPLFDQIDFNNPQALNYMAPGSRREHNTIYTPDDLRRSLEKFVDYVNRREPFLGTPPAYDTPRLMAFYQQIENAVRFSLHHLSEKCVAAKGSYEGFMDAHNQQIPAEEDPDHEDYVSLRRAYQNCLENQARLALNLAIAGKHCGARYMGESMEIYDSITGDASMGQLTLEEALCEILASKRKEIAREEIQIHLGADTHSYNKYMSSLGHILAIPGTESVIEHLSTDFDQNEHLRSFFAKYTVDCIITSVNNKVKSSQVLREKITDWLRDHVGDWNAQIDERALAEELAQLNPILADGQLRNDCPLYQTFLQLQAWISFLKEQRIAFPDINGDWDDCLANCLALDASRAWFELHFPGAPMQRVQIKQRIKSLFSEEQFGPLLIQKVKDAIRQDSPLQVADFSQRLWVLQKLPLLSPHMNAALAIRVLQGQKELREAILEYKEQQRGPNFLAQLIDPEQLITDGLSAELMEWILVSQKVLLVQGE